MTFLLQQTVIYTVPLILVALAGVFAERSGIINLALEGIMIIGAFVGAWFVRIMQEGGWSEDAAQWLLILALLVTAAAGALFSLLLSFSAVKMKADQTIGGTALNLLAPAAVPGEHRLPAEHPEPALRRPQLVHAVPDGLRL